MLDQVDIGGEDQRFDDILATSLDAMSSSQDLADVVQGVNCLEPQPIGSLWQAISIRWRLTGSRSGALALLL